jgi:quinol monooxygenase YgiN
MISMFVRHRVNDYDKWKRGYDSVATVRKEKGVTGASVYRDPNDPNLIIVLHEFKDVDAAMAFANSEELKAAMVNAGVGGEPEFWFGEEIEHTPH